MKRSVQHLRKKEVGPVGVMKGTRSLEAGAKTKEAGHCLRKNNAEFCGMSCRE